MDAFAPPDALRSPHKCAKRSSGRRRRSRSITCLRLNYRTVCSRSFIASRKFGFGTKRTFGLMHVNTLTPDDLKKRNRAWAARMTSEDPDFFRRLERQQAPHYLWIGCSDSRVPANTIVGLDPGELFVHRNVANLASPQDANYLSVLQFAVDVLKVQHIMVVGHYGCGGVSAAVDGRRRGLIDHWLHPIRELSRTHSQELEALQDERSRLDRLCELNVMQQVKNVASDVFVLDAWARGQHLSVHGWVYSIENGLIKDLNVTVSGS